jgi:hypothetical protein
VPWYWRIPILFTQLWPSGADRYFMRQRAALPNANLPSAGAAYPTTDNKGV